MRNAISLIGISSLLKAFGKSSDVITGTKRLDALLLSQKGHIDILSSAANQNYPIL